MRISGAPGRPTQIPLKRTLSPKWGLPVDLELQSADIDNSYRSLNCLFIPHRTQCQANTKDSLVPISAVSPSLGIDKPLYKPVPETDAAHGCLECTQVMGL